jgi:hypothetical protein
MAANEEELTPEELEMVRTLTAVSPSTYPKDVAEALVLSARERA